MNELKTVTLLALLAALLITIAYWIIGGNTGIVIGIIFAAAVNFTAWYFSDRIALAAYNAQKPSETQKQQLQPIVEKLCEKAQLPLPNIYILPTSVPNAFATGRDRENAAVGVTEGLMNLLPQEELEAVIAHELTHIKNRDTLTQTVAATIAGAVSFLAELAKSGNSSIDTSSNNRNNPIGLLLTVLFAPLAATIIQLAISRTREFAADAGAAEITRNPRALANALQRLENSAQTTQLSGNRAFAPLLIVNAFSEDLFSNLFSTHPPTSARIEALMQQEENIPKTQNNTDTEISEDLAPEILDLAARLYSERQNSYSTEELIQAGSGANIPPELVREAIAQIQSQRQQKRRFKQQIQKFVKRSATIFIGFIAVAIVWSGFTYNSLATSANRVDSAWAQVENQFQRRADLIPNLVNVTKGYAQQEKEIVALLIQSRQAYLQADTPQEKATAMATIRQAIDKFQIFAAGNPELQSSQLFINLQYEIAGTENRIATERRRYNLAVSDYNGQVNSFPNVLVAKRFGFEKKEFFKAETTKAPKVDRF